MTMKILSKACALAAAAGAGMAGATAGAEPIDRGALEALFEEPVTLSATGAPQRAADAPVNMTIITQTDIRRSGAVDLPGVLERLPQLDIMRTSASQADVAVRGYNTTMSPRLLVLLNGRQVYLDHYGQTDWDLIPVQMAEIRQIEVVTGPNTALFGFNAVAGVINIITYDPRSDDIDEVSVRVGEPEHRAGSAVWTARVNENLGVRLSLGDVRAEALPNDDAAALSFLGTPAEEPQARSAAFNAVYALNEQVSFDLEATWARADRTARYGPAVFPWLVETNSIKLGVSAETSFGLITGQIYSNFLEAAMENRVSVASLALIAKPAPAHTVRVSAETRRNTLGQDSGSELAYDIYALSGMWNWQATANLALTAAGRFDAFELERQGPFPTPDWPFSNADYDRRIDEWSFNLGAVYRASEIDSLRISAARGAGLPSLLDYGYEFMAPLPPAGTILVAGDPNMAPTIVYNIEAGWDRRMSAIDGRMRAAVFWQRNEDLRSFAARTEVLSFAPFVMAMLPQHIGQSDMHGIELSLEGRAGRWEWDVGYSWRSLDDNLNVPASISQTAFERTSPEHVATAGAAWIGERFEIGADLRYISETQQYGQGALLDGLFEVDPHVLANARVAWRASDTLMLELSARNLFDSQTQSTGLTPVERSVYLQVRTRF
jgi:outer membrane receptor for ferrienterochelin and colicins